MTQAVETMTRQWGHGVTFILMIHLWISGEACPYGFYGPGCFFPCSGNCRNNSTCNSTSGLCDNGCKIDYVGPSCVEKIASFSVPKAAAFAIAAVALCVAITAIALPLVLYYRSKYIGRHRQKTRRNPLSRVLTLNKRGSIFMPSDIQIMKMKSRQSLAVSNGGFVPRDLAINELANLLRYDKVDGYEELNREYQVVPVGEQSHLQCSVSRQRENQFKNRAEITLPYDHSRVKLERTASDYINASYIEMAEDFRCIASQDINDQKFEFWPLDTPNYVIYDLGPLEGTVADHWTMIWQERVSVVVMLTNLMEDDTEKCYPYWYPKGKVLLADSLIISVLHEKVYAFYTTRNIKIEDRETKECRLLCHFQFTRWTDRAIPYPSELVQFYRTVRHAHDSQPKSTLLVHCSDGGGRTGIFIALDKLHRAGRRNSKVNVAKCLTEMCEQRMNIVENVEQYILLYHTLRESFHQHANLFRKENLRRAFAEEMAKPIRQNNIWKEFCELMSVKPIYEDSIKSTGHANIGLNLLPSVLPVDEFRVVLSTDNQCDYHNAVIFSTITDYRGLIAAQYPGDSTAGSLVRLLMEQRSPVVVTIHPLIELHSTPLWYPEVSSELTPFKIQRISSSNVTDEIQQAALLIENTQNHESHRVHVLEIMSWSAKNIIPGDTGIVATVVKEARDIRAQEGNGPITVMSFDGAAGCGVFIAAYNATEQLAVDGAVNLFSVVHDIHIRRPEMITTMDEYEFCYRVVAGL